MIPTPVIKAWTKPELPLDPFGFNYILELGQPQCKDSSVHDFKRMALVSVNSTGHHLWRFGEGVVLLMLSAEHSCV